jgi:methylisocitrate lyase
LTAQEFKEMGFKIVIYPTGVMRVMAKAAEDYLADFKKSGRQKPYLDRMRNRQEIYGIVRWDHFKKAEKDYVRGS